MFRYKLRTLLVLLAVGPPVLALAWWYGRIAIGVLVLAFVSFPELPLVVLAYTFGALCHLIGGTPSDDRKKDAP